MRYIFQGVTIRSLIWKYLWHFIYGLNTYHLLHSIPSITKTKLTDQKKALQRGKNWGTLSAWQLSWQALKTSFYISIRNELLKYSSNIIRGKWYNVYKSTSKRGTTHVVHEKMKEYEGDGGEVEKEGVWNWTGRTRYWAFEGAELQQLWYKPQPVALKRGSCDKSQRKESLQRANWDVSRACLSL